MKKALILALSLVLSLTFICGCGSANTNSNTNNQEETTTSAPKTLKVGLMGKSIKPVGVLVADAMGYYKEEGVSVEFEKVSGMNDAYTAVSKGDLDIYLFSSTAAATFISQGADTLRIFGGTAAEGSEIMAKKDSGITLTKAEDFKGKKIGCFMAETGQVVLKNYLKEAGLTIGDSGDVDVTFVYYQDEQSALEGVKTGEFDLILTNSCKGYFADDLGIEVVTTVSKFVSTYPCCRQTCYQGTYESYRDQLVKFEIATIRGYLYALENKEATLDILEKYSGENRDFLEAQVYGNDKYTPDMRLSLDPDKKACVKFYEAMMGLNQVSDTVEVDWNNYVVTDIYADALNELIKREPENKTLSDLKAYFDKNE